MLCTRDGDGPQYVPRNVVHVIVFDGTSAVQNKLGKELYRYTESISTTLTLDNSCRECAKRLRCKRHILVFFVLTESHYSLDSFAR